VVPPAGDDGDDPKDGRPARPRGLLQRLLASNIGQDLLGGHHALTYLRHLARGNRVERRVGSAEDGSPPPVLLIHGYLGTRGSMWQLEERLRSDDFDVFSFNLGTVNSRDIRTSAFLVHRKIESICAQTGFDKIDIVGHSMGGLIGLYYVKRLQGASRVRRLVMMGAPVRGTWAALAGVLSIGMFSASAWQLLPGSRFLTELGEGTLPPGLDVTTIYADRDWVCPPASTVVPGATAVRVPLGHAGLVVSESTYEAIRHALRKP
jgi:triacylglycerol lipase